MLHILLLILKICGIVLLVILGILLLLICLLLFVPIRYRGEGQFDSESGDGGGKVLVSWLKPLLRVSGGWDTSDKKLHYSVRVLWLTLLSDEKKPSFMGKGRKKKDKGRKKEKDASDLTISETASAGQETAETSSPESFSPETAPETSADSQGSLTSSETEKKKSKAKKRKKNKRKKGGFKKKLRRLIKQIRQKKTRPKKEKKESGQTLSALMEKKDEILALISNEHHQNAVRKILHRVMMIIRYILPVRLKARLIFGMDDPADTGTILAALSVLYGLYGPDFELHPVFDRKIIQVSASFKGRIRLGFFVRMGIMLILDREVRGLIRAVRRFIKAQKAKT